MIIVFRCFSCETINDIPEKYKYRLCKKCGKIITYSPGEAIYSKEDDNDNDEFLRASKLDTKLAEKFFTRADEDFNTISKILNNHERYNLEIPDIPTTSLLDTVLYLLKINSSNTLDEFIEKCELLGLKLNKVEKMILQLKKEGIIYNPQGWIICLA